MPDIEQVPIRALFARMRGVLEQLERCTTRSISEKGIFEKSEFDSIRLNIYRYDINDAIREIDKVLKQLDKIKLLGEKIYQNLDERPYYVDESYDPETGEVYQNTEVSRYNGQFFLKTVEADLKQIRERLIEEMPSQVEIDKKSNGDGKMSHSFYYLKNKNNRQALTDVLDALKKGGFVSQDTSLPNFRKVFSGEEVTAPIRWTRTKTDLRYFIQQLDMSTPPKIRHEAHDKWKITCKCFVNADGNEFDYKKMRSLQDPSQSQMEKLNKIARLL